jgi:hypothetical protein
MSKRKFSMLEESFEFPPIENWKTSQKKVLGCTYNVLKPLRPVDPKPEEVEFVIEEKQENIWAFGKNTRFRITGKFQSMTPAQGNDPGTEWAGVDAADAANVIVAPNFLDRLIESIDLFHGINKIMTSKEIKYVGSYVNTFKYAYMDKEQKQLLCPSAAHPGNGVPTTIETNKGWDFTTDSEWRKYAPNIFKGESTFSFSYVPLDLAPFFQNSNYFAPGQCQKIVPFPLLERFLIRFKFINNWDNIFKIKAGNKKKYRFIFDDIVLVSDQLRLSKTFKTSLLNKRGLWPYEGLTKLAKFENIPESTTTFKTTFQSISMPQGIFVFAVKNTVISGIDKFENFSGKVFEDHKIQQLSFDFDKEWFYTAQPNITNIGLDIIEEKLFFDYLSSPPFDLNMDKDKITLNMIKDGFKNTPYPHVYINLTLPGDTSRLIPFLSEGNILQKIADLDLTFTFESDGAPKDLSYIIYLYYTDNNLTLDTRQKNHPFFFSPYIKIV